MTKIIFIFCLSFNLVGSFQHLMAQEAPANIKTHTHGKASLFLAVDGKSIAVELEAPAINVLGYERTPKNKSDKAKWAQFKKNWSHQLKGVIDFDKKLKCKMTDKKFELHILEKHAQIEAKATFSCQSTVAKSKAKIHLIKTYKGLKSVDVNLLGEKGPARIEIKKKQETVTL